MWRVFRLRKPRTADDIIDPETVSRLAPQKVELPGGRAAMVQMLDRYAKGWPAAIGDVLPGNAPGFSEIREAVIEASRRATPWR
jgi:hypothetical protein